MQLPVWLAEPLAERKYVLVDVPRNYSATVRNSLSADATAISLRDKSPNFYEIGLRLASMSASEDAARLPASIKATLATRVRCVRCARAAVCAPSTNDESGFRLCSRANAPAIIPRRPTHEYPLFGWRMSPSLAFQ
jgi:hypothetical protein